MMRVAILTTDNRDAHRCYGEPQPRFGPAPEALLQGLALLGDRLEIHVVSCTQQPLAAPEKLADNIYYHSVHVPKWGWLRSGYLGCILAVRRKLREIRPDLVHGQGTERECSLCAVFSGFPNVMTIHGNMRGMAFSTRGVFSRFFYGVTAVLEALALARTGGVFCNSAYTERMVAPFCRRRWRVPNALRAEFWEASRAVRGQGTGKPMVLNVGKISPHKRQLELVHAFLARYPGEAPFAIHFVGDAELEHPYAREFVERIRESESLAHAGLLTAAQLRERMASAGALVHCSREEAFGLVLAEAMACGLPVFAFDVGGAAGVIAGVDQARVVADADWTGLLDALENWAKAGAPASSNAAELARAAYSPRVVATRHAEIYEALLEERGRHG